MSFFIIGWVGVFNLIVLTAFLLSMLMGLLALLLSSKETTSEKGSSYECGYNPMYQADKPCSIKFFTVCMLFLVFDLEVMLLLPWATGLMKEVALSGLMVNAFLIILMMGLLYEWSEGGLEWE